MSRACKARVCPPKSSTSYVPSLLDAPHLDTYPASSNPLQAAFGTPEQGINLGPIHGGERELRRLYLAPFRRAIIEAGAWSIMSSYNSYDDVPIVADYQILTEILRDEWGYEFFVISDAGATERLASAFHVCAENDDECITLSVCPTRSHLVQRPGNIYTNTHRTIGPPSRKRRRNGRRPLEFRKHPRAR